jgi:endo-1,4-beta-mannosidase
VQGDGLITGFCAAQAILPLINNWNDTGGVGEVLFWNGLTTHEDFFTDPGARQTYRNTVKAILSWVLVPRAWLNPYCC